MHGVVFIGKTQKPQKNHMNMLRTPAKRFQSSPLWRECFCSICSIYFSSHPQTEIDQMKKTCINIIQEMLKLTSDTRFKITSRERLDITANQSKSGMEDCMFSGR